jgi:hypothetical protein
LIFSVKTQHLQSNYFINCQWKDAESIMVQLEARCVTPIPKPVLSISQ